MVFENFSPNPLKLGFVSVNGPRETYFVDALRISVFRDAAAPKSKERLKWLLPDDVVSKAFIHQP